MGESSMLRKKVCGAAMLAVALATPVLVCIAPVPADAAGGLQCETSGNFCMGSAAVSMDTPVVETSRGSARTITLTPLDQTMSTDLGNLPEYLLQLNATWCVAATNFPATNVTIHKCNGGNGVVWGKNINGNGNIQWVNRYATSNNTNGDSMLLAGHNNGTQFIVHTKFANTSPNLFFTFDPT
jgi:hypothetical protein